MNLLGDLLTHLVTDKMDHRDAYASKNTKEKVLNSNNLLIYYTTICKDLLVLLSPPVCSLPIGKPFSVSTSVPPLAIMLVLLSLPT